MDAAHSAKWTTADVHALVDAMSKSIGTRERNKVWNVALKTFDWNKVAFEGFTAEECKSKWNEIMQKLRKIKTLAELIADAQSAKVDLKLHSPELPKKPVSANALYFAKNKEKFKRKNPGMNSRDLMKFANDKYKLLSPDKKQIYVAKSQQAKEEYQENVKLIQEDHERRKDEEKEKEDEEKEKDVEKNKRLTIKRERNEKRSPIPINGYNLFCHEQKSLLTGTPPKEVALALSSRWRALSEEEKKKYSERCMEMKKEEKRNGTKRKKNDTKTFPGEPKMPARSISALYCKKQMKRLKGEIKGARNRFATASLQSKFLSQQEKDKYKQLINKNFIMFQEQLQEWFERLTPTQQQEYCERNPRKLKYLKPKMLLMGPFHRTSDSEDEDLEDGSSDSDDDVIEVVIESEEEEKPMFDLF